VNSAPSGVGTNRSSLKAFGVVVAGFVVIWIVLERSATWLGSNLGEAGLLVCALVIATALAVERLLFGAEPRRALRRLGFGRPNARAILVGLLVTLAVVSFYPVFSLVTGAQVSLRDGWVLMALGLFLQHGIAEEVLFRGYLFRHLRGGRTFWRAAFLSMVPFVAVHLLLLVYLDFATAFASILVAVATAFPLAYMFERDNNTIWTPALLHGAAHGIKLVSIPDGVFPTAALIWFAVVAAVPYLVFAFPKSYFEPGKDNTRRAKTTPNASTGGEDG
jgi:membrane protease YdiL (CAAX protease family)